MQIPIIIMAGGKSKRMDFSKIDIDYCEKTLLPFKNKSIIEHVINTALTTSNINRVIVAVSPSTYKTKIIIREKKLPIELIDTPGINYHSDLSFIIKSLDLQITMVLSADLPLIKPEILNNIIKKYFTLDIPALTVMAYADLFIQYEISPTQIIKNSKYKKNLVPIGINIIDGRLINLPKINQNIYILNQKELLFNINTIDDYFKLIRL